MKAFFINESKTEIVIFIYDFKKEMKLIVLFLKLIKIMIYNYFFFVFIAYKKYVLNLNLQSYILCIMFYEFLYIRI